MCSFEYTVCYSIVLNNIVRCNNGSVSIHNWNVRHNLLMHFECNCFDCSMFCVMPFIWCLLWSHFVSLITVEFKYGLRARLVCQLVYFNFCVHSWWMFSNCLIVNEELIQHKPSTGTWIVLKGNNFFSVQKKRNTRKIRRQFVHSKDIRDVFVDEQLIICLGGRASIAPARQHKPIATTMFTFWITHITRYTTYQPTYFNMNERSKNSISRRIGWVSYFFLLPLLCLSKVLTLLHLFLSRSLNYRDNCFCATDSKCWISAITIWLQYQRHCHR